MGSYDSFSVLVLWKVRENSWNQSTFSLLLEKPNYKIPHRFLYRVKHTKFVLILKCNTAQVPCLQRYFNLKCCLDLCAMWQIMHRVHLQYLYQCMTKFQYVFYRYNQTNCIYILKYTQLTWGVAEEIPLYTEYRLRASIGAPDMSSCPHLHSHHSWMNLGQLQLSLPCWRA